MDPEQAIADIRKAFKQYERQLQDPVLLAGLLLELLQQLQASGNLTQPAA